MTTTSKVLIIRAAEGYYLSIEGTTVRTKVNQQEPVELYLHEVQEDFEFLDNLAGFVTNSRAIVTMDGDVLTAADVLSLAERDVSELVGGGEFTKLTDVPQTYSGQGGLLVKVKSDESGLEFGANTALTTTFITSTPATLGSGNILAMVDTVSVGAPAVVNLPAAGLANLGTVRIVADVTGDANLNSIVITPNGADTINGVNAVVSITDSYGSLSFQCIQKGSGPATYGWVTVPRMSMLENKESWQSGATTDTLRVVRASTSGVISAAYAEVGTAAAAGESMTFDVQIKGVSCLTGLITIDSTTVIDTPVPGVIDVTANSYVAGDLISVVRVYVPGGGPSPMKDTVCGIQLKNVP